MLRKVSFPTVFLVFSIIFLSFAACGGGGGDKHEAEVEVCLEEYDYWSKDELPLPSSSNLEGDYTLIGFEINVWEDGDFLGTVTEDDFSSWSGNMSVLADTISQYLTLNGGVGTVSAAYTNSPIDSLTGILHINEDGGFYDVAYSIAGDTLTTVFGPHCEFVPESTSVPALEVGEYGIGALSITR